MIINTDIAGVTEMFALKSFLRGMTEGDAVKMS